ncbi:MAG: 16S rRNA processing protein RimM [Chloroflexi bacterium]|nr:16S rRNA processing protein RimM [Chloroflexota bacterium]
MIPVARVVRPHGLRGEVVCDLLTDFPERFARTTELHLRGQREPLTVEASRLEGDRVVLKLAGVASRELADALRGAELSVTEEMLVELPPGSYYWHQLVGLRVETEEGRPLGRLTEVLRTGANDVYVVRGEHGELLLPAIAEVVRGVDLGSGLMRVRLLPGLEG